MELSIRSQTLSQVIKKIIEHRVILAVVVILSVVSSLVSYKKVPKRYKVSTILGLQTQYFQNPLVRDFLPETFDGQELRAQREAIIRRAINPEFLAEIENKYKVIGTSQSAEAHGKSAGLSVDLDELNRKFEVIPTGATSFQISFAHHDPQVAYQIIQNTLFRIRSLMAQERSQTLLRLRDSIQERLETLAYGQQSGIGPIISSRPDLIKKEVERIKAEISELKSQFSDRHPRITELNRKLVELSQSGRPRQLTYSATKVDPNAKMLFEDLLKKYHYLEVVIDLDQQNQENYVTLLQPPFIPKKAVWPKAPIFLIWGIISGFLLGCLVILGIELFQKRRKLV